jgi:hypothetical protein
MKKPLFIALLLFISNIVFGENISVSDSLKIKLNDFSKQKVSIQRDSAITMQLMKIYATASITDLVGQKFWVDSLYRFSKMSLWEESNAQLLLLSGYYHHRIGLNKLGFEELEKAADLFKKKGNIRDYSRLYVGCYFA